MPDRFRLTAPSPEIIASVRHREVPTTPPEPLVPFVVPIVHDGRVIDWRLSDDAVAFGDHDVPTLYIAWRTDWQHQWLLDPVDVVDRLVVLAGTLAGPVPALEELASSRYEQQLPPIAAAALAADLEHAQSAIRERGAMGFGFVDATHEVGRTGLARAWSGAGGPQVVAADDHLAVEMRPEDGMTVALLPPGGTEVRELDRITEVQLKGDVMALRIGDDWEEIASELARPLAWLVPGSTRWRVRQVPEVIVWARTFVGLAEAAEMSDRLGVPVTVSATPLVQQS